MVVLPLTSLPTTSSGSPLGESSALMRSIEGKVGEKIGSDYVSIYNDATIRLNARIFEVPGCVPGTRVNVFYLPWDNAWVYYGSDMRQARLLNKTANANRFNHPKGGTP